MVEVKPYCQLIRFETAITAVMMTVVWSSHMPAAVDHFLFFCVTSSDLMFVSLIY